MDDASKKIPKADEGAVPESELKTAETILSREEHSATGTGNPRSVPLRHPALLGMTSQHLPLLGAAVVVATHHAPHVVFDSLPEILRNEPSAALELEIQRGLVWLGARCAEPSGLPCHYQEPDTGDLRRIPASAVWRANLESGVPPRGDEPFAGELAPFAAAVASALGIDDCWPGVEVVVPRPELDTLLGAEAEPLTIWLAVHREKVPDMLRALARTPHGSTLAASLLGSLENVLPHLSGSFATEREGAGHGESRPPRIRTAHAVATRAGNFHTRWEAGEFHDEAHLRSVLTVELNTRADGTVARSGESGWHRPATIEREVRRWAWWESRNLSRPGSNGGGNG